MEISTNLPSSNEYHVSNVDGVKTGAEDSDSSDEKFFRGSGSKQHRKNFTESDSDMESITSLPINHISKKSRIKMNSDTDSDSQLPIQEYSTTISKSSRIAIKKNKLHNKFKKLKNPNSQIPTVDSDGENYSKVSGNDISDKSDEEISCLKVKEKIMKKKNSLSSICDADTSDDEIESSPKNIKKQRKSKPKSLKPTPGTQPKMSTKQAMENMQKIKSESNRMLREKNVSLPYHKPRALSLQDIINRKKPTLTSDGKAMPIKMNSEQLLEYVKLLEERQKEMIELCKSESEEETLPENSEAQENSHVEQENVSKAYSNDEDNQDTDKSLSDKQFEDIPQINLEVNTENNWADDSAKPVDSSDNILIDNAAKCDSNEQIQNTCLNSEAYQDYSNMDSEALTFATDSEKVLNDCDNFVEERDENRLINEHHAHDIIETDKSNVYNEQKEISNDFSEDENDFNLQDIDKIIENAEIIQDATDTSMSVKDQSAVKPKLTGTPGMFIDLESGDQFPKVLTGVELLKERYTYFSKLKSLEDQEKNRNQKHKPGIQHLKLKHELEEQIAEQRSLEWEKRLEEEKQMKSEMSIEPHDNIEELESKLEKEEEEEVKESSSSDDEDLVEDDVEIKDTPRKSNPMVDEEAEESNEEEDDIKEVNDNVEETIDSADNDDSDNDSSDESSSESEDEKSKPRKGRILKAFEDSDEESNVDKSEEKNISANVEDFKATSDMNENDTQDDEIQLAQTNRSMSEDIFATQGSSCVHKTSSTDDHVNSDDIPCTADLGSQTFSIMNAAAVNSNKKGEINCGDNLSSTQPIDESRFDSFNKIRPGNLSQELLMSQPLDSQSQEIGDDIAALCTGKFYDNQFVTQIQDDKINSQEPLMNISKEQDELDLEKSNKEIQHQDINIVQNEEESKQEENHKDEKKEDCNILQSILDELNEPEIEKQNKFFVAKDKSDSLIKKRFIFDSDEENDEVSSKEKKSKLKKRKLEKRALQISDDEEEEDEALDEEEVEESDIEDDTEKIVEYDSEENEIEVKAKKIKKRIGEFFENEAELTSEDEWAGSGDEDEAGPDRMEREEGDQDVFHQGRLQRELGQIHMREVLDQDKREVRLLQELLFEDGDLGDGHRQRKFRWKTDGEGEDEAGMGPINMTDTQEEEFESEELWRKQRHEREVFLRSMQENEEEESTNTTINRTALIKANLNASNVSKLNETKCTETEPKAHVEGKPTKDIPSPKKPFLILQHNYHGSLLSRGRGALARLAALATPLADDAPRAPAAAPTNYVFATLSQPDPDAKVTKRKAETHVDTPRLLKKMKTQDTQKYSKNSLFDHFKT